MDGVYQMGASEIFLIFFIMIGPLGLIGHFLTMTKGMPASETRKLSWQATGLSLLTLLIAAFGGRLLLMKWHIPIPVMLFTAGAIFFLVAKQAVMAQYQEVVATGPSTGGSLPTPNAVSVSYPYIVSPYGVASAIVLMALSHDNARMGLIVGMIVFVVALDLLTMLYAKQIMSALKPITFRILGAALSVLQMALAVTILVQALRLWKLMPS